MIDFDELAPEQLTELHNKVWEIVRHCGDIGWIADTDEQSPVKEGENIPFLIFSSWEDVRHFYGNLSLNVQELGLVLDTEDEFPDIDFLEKLGIQWGFDDEYEECGECNHVIRTSPTNYGWRPDFWRSPSDGIICGACVRKDPEEYLDWLVNDPTRINVLIPAKELEDWGFRHLPEHYESGWHAGQDANPQQIFETLRQEHPTAEIIFHWEDAGQFDLHFSVYIRDGER